ncbi:hypothetical protein [Cytobacillus sp. Bac17]|uniref:hypothetical protein n=1 Tax=Cytobacillus sp. Bac17 TaxID=2926008 RepID=UPI002119476D|nr:hypothetical protein [Cytobacillus sp. Bac17]
MAVYLITYDLNSPGQDYNKLYEEIKSFGESNHNMESIWFVKTNLTPKTMNERLKAKMDKNDFLFISEVTKNYYGFAPKTMWDWLSSRVSS